LEGTPGKNRTCDLRFRKTTPDGGASGTARPEAEESPRTSGSSIGEAEGNGLRHQADPAPATKSPDEAELQTSALKAALASAVASLNASVGRGAYELNIEVLEGGVGLAELMRVVEVEATASEPPVPEDAGRGADRSPRARRAAAPRRP
jgi:hypothetical protein